MRKILIPSIVMLLSMLLVVSCGKKNKDMSEMAVEEAPAADAGTESDDAAEMAAMPGADAGELWTYITETNSYQEWAFWPNYEGLQPGNSPHGKYLKVYLSESGVMNIGDEAKSSMDNGVIVVKENFMPDTTLAAVTVMYKVEGFNPEVGDWFWAKYGADGTVAASGTPAGCIGCHGAKADNDYLFTGNVGHDDMGDDHDAEEHEQDGDEE